MNKLRLWLGGFLVLQVLLAAGLFWNNHQGYANDEKQVFLAFEQSDVDKVVIQGEEKTASLSKKAGDWILPELDSLPVTGNKVDTVLTKLAGLNANWPIATTKGSHERFDVAEDKFQRRITLYKGDNVVADVLLGSSPGFRKVHVRKVGDDDVFALPLNNYDFPTDDDQWLDKSLIATSNLTSIKGPDYELKKSVAGWELLSTDNNDTPELDGEKANQLSQALTSLRIATVADTEPDFKTDGVKTITASGEKDWVYHFIEKDDKYYVRRDDVNTTFTISQYDYQRIAEVTNESLVVDDKEVTDASESEIESETSGS